MKHLDVKQIEEIIPHRHPFLLVDYIEDYEPGEFAVGYKCVTFREDFFRGHFPKETVMPGVLMVEALAQVGAVAILSLEDMKGKTAYFGGINKCKFRRKVVPGDKLRLETKIIEALKAHPAGYYDAILMDIQMPNMDGYQAAKIIRDLSGNYRTIPIIAMTANAFDEDRQKALSVGMDAHLAKPVDVKRLFGTLRKVIR